MSRRQIVLSMVFALLAPLALAAGTPSRSWRDGELLSRKTVPASRTFLRNQYVYRIRGPVYHYLVVADAPLQLDLHVPIKFATDRKQLFILDADGNEHKLRVLQKASPPRLR